MYQSKFQPYFSIRYVLSFKKLETAHQAPKREHFCMIFCTATASCSIVPPAYPLLLGCISREDDGIITKCPKVTTFIESVVVAVVASVK